MAPPRNSEPPALRADDQNPYVQARWVDVQTVFVPGQGLIRYGDPITVTAEQLASPSHSTIPWSDDWTPDAAIAAQAEVEG
jgi:hypothetical protein